MLTTRLIQKFGISRADKVVFFGSSRVGLPCLKVLESTCPLLRIVTQSSAKQHKSFNDVQIYSKEKCLNWSSPIQSRSDKQKRKEEWKNFISELGSVDLGIVCSYGYMLPNSLIDCFRKGIIIVHPSLLPKYRGGAPIFHAVANGDAESGVSYVEISKGAFDAGNIIHQAKTPISPIDLYDQVEQHLAEFAAQNLPFVLQNLEGLRPGIPQQTLESSVDPLFLKAPVVGKEKKLNFDKPAVEVYNWSRAIMSSKVTFKATGRNIFVHLTPNFKEGDGQIGQLRVMGKKLFVRCSDKYVQIKDWFYPTKKPLAPGIFIAENIKSGKFSQELLRFQ